MAKLSKKRKKFLEKIASDVKRSFYPNGNAPDNFRAKMWNDSKTGDLVIIEVTDNPELWHLPNYSTPTPIEFQEAN